MPGLRASTRLTRVLAGAAAIYLSPVSAHAQSVEVADVPSARPMRRLQSAVFELINETHETISYVAVTCQL
jgi:hypothetical protein